MIDLLSTDAKVFVACAGAGIGLIQDLWRTPGASAYFVGAAVPYAKEETDRFLGFVPENYCSAETAIDLAIASFLRAARVGEHPVGVGITGVVASTSIHRGDHRVHVAAISRSRALQATRVLMKGVGLSKRASDDCMATVIADAALRMAAGLLSPIDPPPEPVADEALLTRVLARPLYAADGRRETAVDATTSVLFPGAFNPLHVGHVEMARAVEKQTGKRVVFELCCTPPHKDGVPAADALRRAAAINAAGHDLMMTREALYIDKARRSPGAGFVIGADAAVRMLDPKWGPEPKKLIREFETLETTFYVFDRGDVGRAQMWDAAGGATARNTALFQMMSGRWDVSSTELRGNGVG